MKDVASVADPKRLASRHVGAALANLALVAFCAYWIRAESAAAPPWQIDPSPFPYIGAFLVAPAVALSFGAAAALRLAPRRPWTPLLHEVASYAAIVGLVVGAGLALLAAAQ